MTTTTGTDVKTLWTQAFDTGLGMQREALENVRDLTRSQVAVARATLRGARASFQRVGGLPIATERVSEAADAVARAVPGDQAAQEAIRRSTAEAMRATMEAPAAGARQVATLMLDPVERMLDVVEAQMEGATNLWIATAVSVGQMNRAMVASAADAWTGAFASAEDAMRRAQNRAS